MTMVLEASSSQVLEVLIAMFIIFLIMKLAWSVVIPKSFIMSTKSEEELPSKPSTVIDKLTKLLKYMLNKMGQRQSPCSIPRSTVIYGVVKSDVIIEGWKPLCRLLTSIVI